MTALKDLANLAVILMAVSSMILVLQLNWRWTLAGLALQYLGVAWLVSLSWPLGLAAVKLVVGWMAGAVLVTSQTALRPADEPLSVRLFRGFTAGLVLVVFYTILPAAKGWLAVNDSVLLGALLLVGMGLLQTGLSNEPARVVIGLLSFMAGFEVLYAALEVSVLVAGLLAVVNLGLALAGAYLVIESAGKEPG